MCCQYHTADGIDNSYSVQPVNLRHTAVQSNSKNGKSTHVMSQLLSLDLGLLSNVSNLDLGLPANHSIDCLPVTVQHSCPQQLLANPCKVVLMATGLDTTTCMSTCLNSTVLSTDG